MDFSVLLGFICLSILLALLLYLISFVLCGKKPVSDAESVQETELKEVNTFKTQCTPRFFAYALCFLLFLAQCVLLFPFAYVSRVLDIFYTIEIMIFIPILIFSLLFGIKSGLFELD